MIIPEHPALRLRIIEIRTLIRDEGTLTCHTKAVGKTFRDIKLPPIVA
jgi:hypothetical protein